MEDWINLPATEKENYVDFHKHTFEEDIKHAEKNLLEFPRWSIISSYYSMHNITKLFLAQRYGIKISSPNIHIKTIRALEYCIKDDGMKKKLLQLLEKAKETYYNIERLKEKILPVLLKRGKQERGKSQYYTEDYTKKPLVDSRKASYFLETIAKPYIELIRKLME